MNRLSVVAALTILLGAAAAVFLRSPPGPAIEDDPRGAARARLEDGKIVVLGERVSLADLSRAINDPRVFRCDPKTGVYTCNASLEIVGSLRIGDPEKPDFREVLEIRTFACGDRSITVRKDGELSIHNSEVATVLRDFDSKLCSRGYSLFTDGRLNLDNATLAFMSGSFARPARKAAEGAIANSRFIEADGNAFFAEDVDGEVLVIRDTQFESRGNYGFVVLGPGRHPLRLARCRLRGAASDLHHAGKDAEVILLDCDFRKEALSFNQLNGIVTVQWTVQVEVRDQDGQPCPGRTVKAESDPSCGLEERTAVQTDARGRAQLVLTEFVADPFNPTGRDGINKRTPHQIWVTGRAGEPAGPKVTLEAAGPGLSLSLVTK